MRDNVDLMAGMFLQNMKRVLPFDAYSRVPKGTLRLESIGWKDRECEKAQSHLYSELYFDRYDPQDCLGRLQTWRANRDPSVGSPCWKCI